MKKDSIDDLIDFILARERPKLDNIMREVASKIQDDVVATTYMLLDQYYENYTFEQGRHYIRIDELAHPRNNAGKFRSRTKSEQTRLENKGKSLYKTIKTDGDSIVGVAKEINGEWGYTAGVVFDESYFDNSLNGNSGGNISGMHHTGAGISEWDIVNNFLFSNSEGKGNHAKMRRSPEADAILINYINNYKSTFDKHYNDALKKYK